MLFRSGGRLAEFLAHGMAHVHVQVTQTRDEVVQIAPDQGQRDELHEPARHKAQANVECRREFGKGNLGADRVVEHPDDQRHEREHQQAADAVQDGHPAGRRQAVGGQITEGVDVAEFRPLFGEFSHVGTFSLVTGL